MTQSSNVAGHKTKTMTLKMLRHFEKLRVTAEFGDKSLKVSQQERYLSHCIKSFEINKVFISAALTEAVFTYIRSKTIGVGVMAILSSSEKILVV